MPSNLFFFFTGILTPAIYFVDLESHKIYMEHMVEAVTVKDYITDIQQKNPNDFITILQPLAEKIGNILAIMHRNNIIHGDLTTSNILMKERNKLELVMIDFGLGYIENVAEDKGVDLYVLERALLSTHPNTESVFEVILKTYEKNYGKGAQAVIDKLEEVRLRGRKRTMVGWRGRELEGVPAIDGLLCTNYTLMAQCKTVVTPVR